MKKFFALCFVAFGLSACGVDAFRVRVTQTMNSLQGRVHDLERRHALTGNTLWTFIDVVPDEVFLKLAIKPGLFRDHQMVSVAEYRLHRVADDVVKNAQAIQVLGKALIVVYAGYHPEVRRMKICGFLRWAQEKKVRFQWEQEVATYQKMHCKADVFYGW